LKKKLFPLLNLILALLSARALHAQTLSVDQQSLTFTAQVSGSPTSQPLNVGSSPSAAIVLATAVEQTGSSVSWLAVSPSGGQTPLQLTVTVNPASLTTGTYTGSIVISTFGGSGSITVPVTVTVSSITVTPSSLAFQTSFGDTPLVQAVTLTSGLSISFTVGATTSSGGNWLLVSPASGSVSSTNPIAVVAIPNTTVVPSLSPGTYNGTITITPTSGSALTPIAVPVTLTVLPAPPVTVSPASVNINYQIGGTANSPQQTVTLSTTNAQGVDFTISAISQTNPSGGVWVVPTPTSGLITSAGTPVSIAYNTAVNLTAGTWTSTVKVSTPNGSPTETDIPVTLVVASSPLLNVPTSTLNFTYELGAADPAAQSVAITSTSASPQQYIVSVSTTDGGAWLVALPTGTTPTPLSISVNPAGLAPGSYTGTVSVMGVGTGNGAQQIPVTLKVYNDPAIVTNIATLALPYQIGQAKSVSQAIAVSSSNGVPLSYVATATTTSCGTGWLSLNGAMGATSGASAGQVTVAVNPQSLAAGTCQGAVSVAATNSLTGATAINSPITIPVTLTVSAGALLVVSPPTPAIFTAPIGGSSQGPLNFTLTSSGTDQLSYAVSTTTTSGGSGWIEVSQTTGQTVSGSNTLGISVQPGPLAAGTYTGAVTIAAVGPAGGPTLNSPVTIPVVFTVTTGSLVLSPTALSFSQATGGTPPASQTVAITSSSRPLNFAASAYAGGSVSWLTVTPSGSTPGSISVGVDGSKLAQGTYTGTVVVISTTPNAGNSPAFVTVTLSVNAGTISASPASLVFTQPQGGPPPAAQSLTVSGTPVAIAFQATASTASGGAWLSVSPTNLSTPATLQVTVAASSLAVGSYSGAVSINAAGAVGSPILIPVTLNVVTQDNLSATPTTVVFNAAPGATASQSLQIQVFSANGPAPYSVTAPSGSFFTVSPTSGTTPGQITVTANPTGFTTGAYSATFTIGSPNSVSTVTATVDLVVGGVAPPVLNAVANAASYSTGGVAPGENIVIFGSGIGPPAVTKGTVTNGVVDTSVAATRVLFDGVPAPVIYASATQSSAMVPFSLSGRAITNIVVEYRGVQSNPIAYTVTVAAPGIYSQNQTGTGPGAILNQDYSLNLPGQPAPKGSVVSIYMTGAGFTTGAVDGAIATGLLSPVLPVSATVGGIPVTPLYSGTSPGIVTGVLQVNVGIPSNAPSGSAVPIIVTMGTGATAASTQAGITVAVE
jgi:uncharacterized protein (TIGR03437 family)